MREHRVEVNDLRGFAFPGTHTLDGVAGQQAHAPDNRPHFFIHAGPRQAIFQQRGNQRLALDEGHLAAQAGQHERILAQPRRGIQHLRSHPLSDAHRLGNHLPVAAAKLAPVRGLAFDEVHPHRPRCLRAQLLDLQTINAHLHGKPGSIVLQRQLKALCPRSGLRLEFSRQRLDPDTCALLFHHSHLEIEPSH